jgi:hypothetical protein
MVMMIGYASRRPHELKLAMAKHAHVFDWRRASATYS